jgi:hypothetical protein
LKTLISNNEILIQEVKETFLTAQASSSGTTLTVQSIVGFAVDQILLIGELGDENSEIIKTHASTAPTGTTITLASALTKTHDIYTKVRIIPYDQLEIHHATTTTGEKTLLDTIDIQCDSQETRYNDTTKSSGYYFTRLKNTISPATYSDYSDPIPYAGYGENTVGFAINYALKRNKMESFTNFIDYQFCIDEINACLDFITGKLKGWTNLLKLNEIIGQTERGVLVLGDMPSDIWENKGNKSILDLRIGTSTALDYLIWSDLEKKMEGVYHTQVRTEAAVGSTTLEIDNSYDFASSGSVNVYVSGTLQTITYTGVTRSSTEGVLTGVPASGTGSITATIPVDTDVWSGETEGEPVYYSINSDSEVVIWPLPDSSYRNLNGYMDYWTGATKIDSDNDTLDMFRYDGIKHWLTWAIRMQNENNGKRDFNDGDYLQFMQILADKIRNEKPAHRHKRGANVNSITY